MADVHAAVVTCGGAINQPVSSACVPSFWPDTPNSKVGNSGTPTEKTTTPPENEPGLVFIQLKDDGCSSLFYPTKSVEELFEAEDE